MNLKNSNKIATFGLFSVNSLPAIFGLSGAHAKEPFRESSLPSISSVLHAQVDHPSHSGEIGGILPKSVEVSLDKIMNRSLDNSAGAPDWLLLTAGEWCIAKNMDTRILSKISVIE